MSVTDKAIAPGAKVAIEHIVMPLVTAVAQTAEPFFQFKPGYRFEVVGVKSFCNGVTVVTTADVVRTGDDGVLSATGLAIDSTAEEYQVGAFTYVIGGVLKQKAAETGVAFTAAHVVTLATFGIVLIQINAAGTLSSKVPAATATTAFGFPSAAAALAHLPEPDANNAAVGYIAIAADAGNWVAITDDMTDASDLTTAGFNDSTPEGQLHATTMTYVALASVEATLVSVPAQLRGDADDTLVGLYTTDADGALVNGQVIVSIRPYPLNGEVLKITGG